MDEFDDFVSALQKEIDKEVQRDYSDKAIELMKKKYNWGKIENANTWSRYTGSCGDTMEFFIYINENEIIEDISFLTDGCSPSVASGSQATILAKGKSVKDALNITSDDILNEIGKLAPEDAHCPVLAETAFKLALRHHYLLNNS
ncbi:MAG: iron-sulfur cluster assembly scaffold protein [Promethearchaeota archaeon]